MSAVGCGSLRKTLPDRSAMEQLLISSAADEAVEKMAAPEMIDKTIYLDTTNLDAVDKEYVVERFRMLILESGGRLTKDRGKAELEIEIASGALSMDTRDWLLGLPQLPIPLPMVQETLRLPEVALFKTDTFKGRAKLVMLGIDPESGAEMVEPRTTYGTATNTYIWVLLFGPFQLTDLPEEVL